MLAFVFPGQGSQIVGMGRDLYKSFGVAREVFQAADEAAGMALSRLCFEGPADELDLTENSQPAIVTVGVAALRALQQETGLVPGIVTGHSLGEYTAAVAAGALSLADAVALTQRRGRLMQSAVPVGEGGMAAVMGMAAADVEALCAAAAQGRVLAIATLNGGGQVVIAGHRDALDRAMTAATEKGGVVRALAVSAPFHCALMEPAASGLREALASVTFKPMRTPLLSSVDCEIRSRPDDLAAVLVRQLTAPVRWDRCMGILRERGVDHTIEVGAGNTLTRLLGRAHPEITAHACGTSEDTMSLAELADRELATHRGSFVDNRGVDWTRRPDGSRINAQGTEIVWRDGVAWAFHDPDGHGF